MSIVTESKHGSVHAVLYGALRERTKRTLRLGGLKIFFVQEKWHIFQNLSKYFEIPN